MDRPAVDRLLVTLQAVTEGSRTLDRAIGDALGFATPDVSTIFANAYSLLPRLVTNFNLFSFGVREGVIGDGQWGCRVHDREQLVGIERAKRNIKRLPLPLRVGGEPRVIFERAIAEQFCEFSATHLATTVLAVCTVALKVRIGRTTDDDLWPEP